MIKVGAKLPDLDSSLVRLESLVETFDVFDETGRGEGRGSGRGGSGMVKGIGPIYAKRLVQAFGEAVFEVIEQAPERLQAEVAGIGPKRAARIIQGWAEQKVVREIMLFLHSHGIGTSRAVRIFKTYGVDAIQVITENPYRLARDIRGIGFKSADQIAMRLGIENTAMIRARAGVSYARVISSKVVDIFGEDVTDTQNYNSNLFLVVVGATYYFNEHIGLNAGWSKALNNLQAEEGAGKLISRNIILRGVYLF